MAWDLTHSFAWLGIVALAEALGLMLVMPVGGALADRMDRLVLARRARTCELLVASSLAITVFSGAMAIHWLIPLVVLAGAAQGLWSPARMAMMPNLVAIADVPAALALGATLFHLSHFIGPVVAGWLITGAGVGYAFVCNAMTFVLSLVVLSVIRLQRHEHESGSRSSLLSGLAEGLRYVRHHPAIGPLVGAGLVMSVALRSYRELLAGYADDLFAQGADGLAALASGSGLGALLAALAMASYARTAGLSRVLVVCMAANLLAQVAFALAPRFGIAVLAAGALGFLVTTLGMSAQILLQNAVPGAKRGRVMSLWGVLFFAGPPLGAWLAGTLATGIGIRGALLGLSAVVAVYLLPLFRNRHALARLEQQPGP